MKTISASLYLSAHLFPLPTTRAANKGPGDRHQSSASATSLQKEKGAGPGLHTPHPRAGKFKGARPCAQRRCLQSHIPEDGKDMGQAGGAAAPGDSAGAGRSLNKQSPQSQETTKKAYGTELPPLGGTFSKRESPRSSAHMGQVHQEVGAEAALPDTVSRLGRSNRGQCGGTAEMSPKEA